MATIRSIIENLVDQLVEIDPAVFEFYYGRKSFQNQAVDELTLPCAFLDDPITTEDAILNTGSLQPVTRITLFFGDKSELDMDAEQHEAIILPMRSAAREFVIRCEKDVTNIRQVKDVKRTDVINLFDQNLSGCLLELTLVLYDNDPICFENLPAPAVAPAADKTPYIRKDDPDLCDYFVPCLSDLQAQVDQLDADLTQEIEDRQTEDAALQDNIDLEALARAEADAELAPLASPEFTGNPTAPTPSAGDNDTSIATTAFVTAAITAGKQIYTDTAGILTAGNYLDWTTPHSERYFYVILTTTLAGQTPYTHPLKFRRIAPERGVLKKTKRVGVSGSTSRLNGIFYHTGTQKVYSANSATNNVTIFDATTFELLATIVFTGANFIFYVTSIDEIWVTSNNTLILRINPTTNASLGTFAPASANMHSGINYSAAKTFIANSTLNRLDVINPSTFVTDANIATQTAPRFPHLHTVLDRIFLVNQTTNSVSIINPTLNTNVANVSLAGVLTTVTSLCYISSLDKYLLTDGGANTIVIGTPTALTMTFGTPIKLPTGYITRNCVYIPEQDVVVITATSVNIFWELFVFDVQTNKITYNWLINATGIGGATPTPLGLTYNNDLKEVIAGAEQHGRLECFKV